MRKILLAILLLGTIILALGLAIGRTSIDVEAIASSDIFIDTGQSLGNEDSRAVAMGVLDGQDGPDAFVANYGANRVWLNDGDGIFSANGQSLGSLNSEDVALGDLNGDKTLDAVVANSDGLNQVWLNNGNGQFVAGQSFEGKLSRGVALGDLDGDTDLDAFFANSGSNTIWLNVGGVFSDTEQNLGSSNAYDVALADIDGDGDLDAFVANGLSGAQPDKIWVNQGGLQGGTEGEFSDSGQNVGLAWTNAVALGNLDGDPLPDAFSANWFPNANNVFLNAGGVFSNSGQALGSAASIGVALGDIDGDIDLDAFVTNNYPNPSSVWLNDGSGSFNDSGQQIGDITSYDVGLVDLDGDGDLDAFIANFGANTVYTNGLPGVPKATFDIDRATNNLGQEVTYWAQEGDALLSVLLSVIAPQNMDVLLRAESASMTVTNTLSFAAGELVKSASVTNPAPDPSEEITLTLSVEQPDNLTDNVLLIFVDGEQGDSGCILCYVEWLARLVGFDPGFGLLHHAAMSEQRDTRQWTYYADIINTHSPEVVDIIARHPTLLWDSLSMLNEWTPAMLALSDGNGEEFTVTQIMADEMINVLDGLAAQASPNLQHTIQREQIALDLPSFAGLNMDEAWETLVERAPIERQFLPAVVK